MAEGDIYRGANITYDEILYKMRTEELSFLVAQNKDNVLLAIRGKNETFIMPLDFNMAESMGSALIQMVHKSRE